MTDRLVVRSIDVRSVVTVTFTVVASLWGILLVAFVALYLVGLVSGGLGGVEGFIASLGFTGFRFTILPFILAFLLVAVLAAAVSGLVAGIFALLYNHVQPLVGGIVIRTKDR